MFTAVLHLMKMYMTVVYTSRLSYTTPGPPGPCPRRREFSGDGILMFNYQKEVALWHRRFNHWVNCLCVYSLKYESPERQFSKENYSALNEDGS